MPRASRRSSATFFDTQALVWAAATPERLTVPALARLSTPGERLFISAVTAFEYIDLNRRGRFGSDLPIAALLSAFAFTLLPFPPDAAEMAAALPDIHRDPVDRMLIGHALAIGAAIVTADATIRRYPVATIW